MATPPLGLPAAVACPPELDAPPETAFVPALPRSLVPSLVSHAATTVALATSTKHELRMRRKTEVRKRKGPTWLNMHGSSLRNRTRAAMPLTVARALALSDI